MFLSLTNVKISNKDFNWKEKKRLLLDNCRCRKSRNHPLVYLSFCIKSMWSKVLPHVKKNPYIINQNHIFSQPTISLKMPVPSQGHYGFHSFLVVD
jgi:hypothetical protein